MQLPLSPCARNTPGVESLWPQPNHQDFAQLYITTRYNKQSQFQLLANDEHTHENKIPTFLCSGDGNLASNEGQASLGTLLTSHSIFGSSHVFVDVACPVSRTVPGPIGFHTTFRSETRYLPDCGLLALPGLGRRHATPAR